MGVSRLRAPQPCGHFCPVQGQGHRAEGSRAERIGAEIGQELRVEHPEYPLRAETGALCPTQPLLLKGSPGINSTSLPRGFLDPGQADGVGTCLLEDLRQFMYLVKFERPWAWSLLSWGAMSGARAAGGSAGVVRVLEASPPAGRLWTGETCYHSHKQLCVVPGPPAIPRAETRCQPHLQMGKQRPWRLSILSQVRQ